MTGALDYPIRIPTRNRTRTALSTASSQSVPSRGARTRLSALPSGLISKLLSWFSQNARALPWRRTRDPYAIWVSEIMLQQTQVKTVLPYRERWMTALPDIRSLARAKSETIHKLWEGLGYYHRVRNMQKAARIILAQHGGRFPSDFDDVLELPGIGRYTAGAICSIAFNQPTPILDGNVIRVLTRLFGITGDPREKKTNARLWTIARQLVETAVPESCSDLNQSLMELGALICTARNPRCAECPISSYCVALRQDRVNELPASAARPRVTRRHFVAFVATKGKSVFVRQRPAGVVNAHLWEFPNVEIFPGDGDLQKAAQAALGIKRKDLKPFCTVKHSITRYAITLDAFIVTGPIGRFAPPGRWLPQHKLASLPFCSAHKKILQRLRPEN